jgi:hypothetical protein
LTKRTDAATAARKVPDGWRNVRVEIRLPESEVEKILGMSPVERGQVWMNGMSKPSKDPEECMNIIREAAKALQDAEIDQQE